MARITVEDCLTRENNRFALVQLASKRTKQLLAGARTLITEGKGNKAVVTALREIAHGGVRFMTPEDEAIVRQREARLKEIEMESTIVASSPADDLFILPVNGTKDTNGAHLKGDAGDGDDDDDDIPIDEEDEAPAGEEDLDN